MRRRRPSPARRLAWAAAFGAHMLVYTRLYEAIYRHPWRVRRRLRIQGPIRADAVLGLGTPLPQRLQAHLRPERGLSALDKAVTAFYYTWEAFPHLALAGVLVRRPERFPAAAARVAATFDLTLVFHALLPSAPPWWASEVKGELGGQVERVTVEVERHAKGQSRRPGHASRGANPWATMPSNHLATSATAAMVLGELDARLGATAWAYTALLGLSLVYLGEHYAVDLLGGLAAAGAVSAAAHAVTA